MIAVILYDDRDLAMKALARLKNAAHPLEGAVQWNVRPWRLDLLQYEALADAALAELAAAALVVVAADPKQPFPGWLANWLDRWAGCRQVQDAAVAVFGAGSGNMPGMEAAPGLAQIAERHGLEFIHGLSCANAADRQSEDELTEIRAKLNAPKLGGGGGETRERFASAPQWDRRGGKDRCEVKNATRKGDF